MLLGLFVGFCLSACGQGITTLTAQGAYSTNSITIASDRSFTLRTAKSSIGDNGCQIHINRDGVTAIYGEDSFKVNDNQYTPDITFAGPAEVVLKTINTATWSMITLDIQPAQYPPDKAAVIGPHSGPMRVTMETTTDLINWGTATNDITYPDSEQARFFRKKLQKDIP